MCSRAKKLLQLAITRSSEGDHDQLSGGGCVVEFVPETKLNTVHKESPALNVAEEKDHQIEPGIESDQMLQSIIMDEENNLNLPNMGLQNTDTTINKMIEKRTIEQEEIANENKRLKTSSTAVVLQEIAEPMLGVVSITHEYLVIGHTQNEGDSVHSTIEREKTRILKNGSIFVPTQWKSVIQCAKKTETPYEVYELDFSDILDLKDLVTQFGKNFTTNNDGDRVVWNDIKKIFMQAYSPYLIFYNDTYNPSSTMKCLNVRNKTRGRGAANVELHLRNKYHQRPKISSLKKKDLLSLCDSNVIPRVYREYYSSLEATDNHMEPDEHNEND